jgi:uncharacterized protein (TIGR02996 family)|nr:TIGR02996 domain-containing protein [Kofleriaceae bacterium]
MSGDLAAAVAVGAWPRALELAISAWRASRTSELADLVEAVGARVDRPRKHAPLAHAAWQDRARDYHELAVGGLFAVVGHDLDARVTWDDLETRHGGVYEVGMAQLREVTQPYLRRSWSLALFDRILTIAAWPDDPRTAALFARWLVALPPLGFSAGREAMYRFLGWRLRGLGDARAIPRLLRLAAEPTAPQEQSRATQREVARDTAANLRVPPRDDDAAALFAQATAQVAAPRADVEALWREVGADPYDDGPRAVLADALTELGDPRGELIAMQLRPATPKTAARVVKLAKLHWYDWLGDAALAITRRNTRFVRGMIDEVSVGMHETPPWAFVKAARHRELACVRAVHAHQCTPDQFVDFIDALPHEPVRLGFHRNDFAAAIAARPRATRQLEYRSVFAPYRLAQAFAELAQACRGVDEVWIARDGYDIPDAELTELVAVLPRLFPALRLAHVDARLALTIVDPPPWLVRASS